MNIHGILLINKPINITSNKTIQIIKNKFKIKKLGHCGTLDPSASGLLIVCIGNKTKKINNIILYKKTYIITALIGIKSKSNDLEDKITFFQNKTKKITSRKIKTQLNNIKNQQTQIPSIFSSIKHNGMKLYQFARLEINIKTKKRPTKIYNIILIKNTHNLITLKIKCSHGVYMRTIIDTLSAYIKQPICTLKIERLIIQKYNILKSYNISKKTNIHIQHLLLK